jgi:hypothetical protein
MLGPAYNGEIPLHSLVSEHFVEAILSQGNGEVPLHSLQVVSEHFVEAILTMELPY